MKKTLLILLALGYSLGLFSQGSEEYGSGLKVNLNEEGSKYIRFIVWNQIWTRAIENNPGTAVNGQAEDWTLDAGIRRARLLAYAQISPRFMILTHLGINNQTFANGGVPGGGVTGNGGNFTSGKKPGLFFHDVWNEYAIVGSKNLKTGEKRKSTLYLGSGLHYWHGISRMTHGSTLNFLAIDAPIFNWPTIELSDQFARYFGIYAKGKLWEKVDYRVHVSKPFALNNTPPIQANGSPLLNVAVDNNLGGKWLQSGYVSYQFLDQESNLLPFAVGTYVGTKRVFNIGLGFQNQPQSTQSWQAQGQDTVLQSHNVRMLGLDVFADLPLPNTRNMALTAYSVLYFHNWGPKYYRNVGIMNVGAADPGFKGQTLSQGFGNARPLLGTGRIFYTQAGLLLPREFLGIKDRIQPFATTTLQQLEALEGNVVSYDLGCNYYISGHHAKITFQYSARPQLIGGKQQPNFGKEFIVQTQIFL
jgi:hypothetical protein